MGTIVRCGFMNCLVTYLEGENGLLVKLIKDIKLKTTMHHAEVGIRTNDNKVPQNVPNMNMVLWGLEILS